MRNNYRGGGGGVGDTGQGSRRGLKKRRRREDYDGTKVKRWQLEDAGAEKRTSFIVVSPFEEEMLVLLMMGPCA